MCVEWSLQKKAASRLRKLLWLPRIGIYVDVLGYEFTLKKVPYLEAFWNVAQTKISPANFRRILKEQLAEVQFARKREVETVNASHRTLFAETKESFRRRSPS